MRSDAYGGTVEKRLRLAFEIIEAIRAEVGREFVLGIRLCGDELIDGGVTIRETIAACQFLRRHGMLDYFNTSYRHGYPYSLYGRRLDARPARLSAFCVERDAAGDGFASFWGGPH